MEDNLLFEAIERYNRGEMSPEEKTFFEELRKNNPAIDQMVVEHSYFLEKIESVGERRSFKKILSEVERKLEGEGVITRKGNAKVIYLWNRYKRIIAVAASVAIFFSIFTATLISIYTGDTKVSKLTPLVDNKISKLEVKVNQLQTQINNAAAKTPVKPPFIANFRATGFLIDGNGYIITNAHVVNNANNLIVENSNGDQYSATPLYADKISDLVCI